ncbi:hypothetical protein R75461_05284 [Paraburkholderia nemoris]|uniref:hypothetical protein n=1 Tax=Paraburkholderia nemoris TaxID=2793076 RepID=UPI00190A1F30|nr:MULTISPECIES: hypothetical protein [Paraburkholderia]MBK3783943.1 hypothetical protein [Paraburkholderia aspalathi]CAE6803113.1 hypothetical protein R75461_05284 [Paraburkholderia nemoris]
MSDKSSGRNPATNAGSDSAIHQKGTASQQYGSAPAPGAATPVTGKLSSGYVGNGTPPKADQRSAVK